MVKTGQKQTAVAGRSQGSQGSIVSQPDLVALPAELGTGEGSAGIADATRGQVQVDDQGTALLTKQAHFLFDKRPRNLVQHLGDGFHCFLVAGSQCTADASVMGQGDQPPGANGWPIVSQGMGALVQILQMGDASQDAHQKGQHLGLRRMNDALLGNGYLIEFANQTDLISELSPGHHQSMLSEQALRQFRHTTQPTLHRGSSDVQG